MDMIFNIGLASLFFLPVIESFNRSLALHLLLTGSVLLFLPYIAGKKVILDFISLLFLAILIIFSASLITSWSISRSYIELLRYLAYFLIFVSFKNSGNKGFLIKRFLVPSVIINSLILSLISLTYFIPLKLFPIPATGMNLHYPTFGYNRLAIILIFALPLSLALAITVQMAIFKKIMLIMSVLFLIILVSTNGRGAILSLALAMIASYILFIMKIRIKSNRFLWEKFAGACGIIAITILTVSFIFSNFLIIPQQVKVLQGLYKPAAYEQRLEYFAQSLAGFMKSPILGTGLDTFRYVSKIYQKVPVTWSWYSHNHFLQIFTETGIAGGILFFLLIFLILKDNYRVLLNMNETTVDDMLLIGIFTALLASIIHSLMDYDWQYISILLLFFMGTAVISKERRNFNFNLSYPFKTTLAIIVLAMFFIDILIPLDAESLLLQAKLIALKDRQKALNLLKFVHRIDRYNQDITIALANFYESNKDFNQAHQWYQESIVLTPIESSYLFLIDYRLYLGQAQELLKSNDLAGSYSLIDRANNFHTYAQNFDTEENYLHKVRNNLDSGNWKVAQKYLTAYIETAGDKLLNVDFAQINLKEMSVKFKTEVN